MLELTFEQNKLCGISVPADLTILEDKDRKLSDFVLAV